jgi:hypothetical protein
VNATISNSSKQKAKCQSIIDWAFLFSVHLKASGIISTLGVQIKRKANKMVDEHIEPTRRDSLNI